MDDANPTDLTRAVARLADLVEGRLAPALERIAAALERSPAQGAMSASAHREGVEATVEVRRAIGQGDWIRAGALAEAAGRDDPEAAARLVGEVESGRRAAIAAVRDRIDAARDANDLGRVLSLRDELDSLLLGEPAPDLDRLLAKWFMATIQRRLFEPPIGPEVAEMAGAVADRFPGTTEGASLRKALPTLRRSAGLCPRCAEPYTGIEDACPKCLAGPSTLPLPVVEPPPVEPGAPA
ncbi:MAG TPA: hypothetical protein VG406_01570 [Isosphaeraceae bacterium]|jgi:hypothetical protein|nr:hypothetical protein [Isosphaeraceae bacterium]